MRIDELRRGVRLGPSDWITVDQAQIDKFADATHDHQWIHVDPDRAKDGPYRTTIAHGWLTLSLVAPFTLTLLSLQASTVLNYGVNRVRFPAPVPVDARIRATFEIAEVTDIDAGVQVALDATVEREGHGKPCCVAQLLIRAYH